MPQRQRLLEVCAYIFIVSVRQPVGEEGELDGDGRRGPCPWVYTAGSATIDRNVYTKVLTTHAFCVHSRAPTLPADIQRQ